MIASSNYKLLSENHFRQYLETIIREIVENICYKLLPEKSLQTIYMLTYCYQRNLFKQILQTTGREVIANSTYKLLSENHSKQYLKIIATETIADNT